MLKSIKTILLSLAVLTFMVGCDPEEDPGGGGGGGTDIEAKEYGTLEVEFRIPGSFLPPNRVLRADLSLAISAEELYKGNFCYVANVYNTTLVYNIRLEPGSYYYQAGIICIAKGDSCSAASFPGGQFGMKWAIGRADIRVNEPTHVVPQFTQ